ncbi:hypothetical protein DH2020_039821 [Rehmannia glutinosa]|uniref:RRM domain-containing protein n=1 Tax=Rehmannia glutinosa TaxID=99300 RepID=A0ABR0UVH2_REHGL
MSLHIGNLSSRIRRDDLERVFRRFGRCTIQVKDKYGFVVYDYPASAEKALKTLRGTRICGEAITLSWSTRQPRALQRFGRGGKSYEPPRRRYPVKENADRRLGSNDRRDYEMDTKKADGEVGKLASSDLVDDSTSYQPYDSNLYVGERDRTSPNDLAGGDRWGEQVVDPSNEKYVENGPEFDRYEPYHSDGKKELDEPSIRKCQEKIGSDKEASTSRNRRRLLGRGNSPPRIAPRGRRKEFRDKKRNWRDYENRDKNRMERARGPSSSSIHSDYTSARSQSPSKSKSVPSKKISLSDSLRSSPSCHSGTKTSKSRSTSRSMSPTSSLLPVKLNRRVSPSPDKRQENSKGSVANAVSLAHSTDLFGKETLIRSSTGTSKSENITSAVENEFETKPAKLEQEYMEKDLSDNNNDNDNDNDFEMSDSQNEDLVGAPESNMSIRSNASNSARMSPEEIYMVLKHYGLQYPEEREKDLPVETYFGSARLWPWEIIYYRRLKKGPISAENYSRRISQNEEFGIVDKYVRGSSGWGELNEHNP